MARNQESDDDALDWSQCACPACGIGSGSLEILKYPEANGGWFGSGRAQCKHCGHTFSLSVREADGNWVTGQKINPALISRKAFNQAIFDEYLDQ
jgi:hypothetical protein